MRTAALTGILAAALLAGGCSAATATSPGQSPAAKTTAASPKASKTAMTRKQGAAYYVASVKAYNTVYTPCVVIEQDTTLSDRQTQRALSACRKLPGAVTSLIRRLEHPPAPWPAEVRDPIRDMIEYLGAFRYCVKDLRHARAINDYWQVAGKSCPDDLAVSNLVRAHLGLPRAEG